MKSRPDLFDKKSPAGIEVVQLTSEDVPSSHVYMEAQIFTPDSKRFLLHRSAHPHGSNSEDPEHRYIVCDLEESCRLSPLTEETGATAPSITPDGQTVYYFVDEIRRGGGRIALKRVDLDGACRETVMVVDAPLPEIGLRPSSIYSLSTISSDGKRLALSCILGDGKTENAPGGLLLFDLEKTSVNLIVQGPSWCNMHPQYCRCLAPEESHDILIQENHGNIRDANGKCVSLVGGNGADIHVLRDDGTDLRDMPWGRDGNEFCQGHQCWRGRSAWAITSTSTIQPHEQQLIEGLPAPHGRHTGIATPGGRRNDLTRSFPDPQFSHFATDLDGRLLISDWVPPGRPDVALYLMELADIGEVPVSRQSYLLDTRSTRKTHVHPFLSPDGRRAFFNSDESGVSQAYMIQRSDCEKLL